MPGTIELIPRFQDFDLFGHLNNAQYLNYFHEGRSAQLLRDLGYDIPAEIQTGIGWLLGRAEIEFLRPVAYGAPLFLTTWAKSLAETHMTAAGRFHSAATGGKDYARVWMRYHRVTVATGKAIPIEPPIRDMLIGFDPNVEHAAERIRPTSAG